MAGAVRNTVHLAGVPLEHALRFASANPAAFLGLKLGRLAPGYRADMIALDPHTITVAQTWVAGRAADGGDAAGSAPAAPSASAAQSAAP
jgi:N-acetylglucosamine-6-phosphate deacetylase